MRNIFLRVAHSLLIVSGFLGLGLWLMFAEGTQVVTTTTAPTSTLVTITDGDGNILGRVTDALSLTGIVGAKVSADTGGYLATTDADGYYTITNVVIGDYILTASATGYIPSTPRLVTVAEGEVVTVNFSLVPVQPLTPTPGVTPSPTLSPKPECNVEKMLVSPSKLRLKRGQSDEVNIILEGVNCVPEGKTIIATIRKAGSKYASVKPASENTNANGEAKFAITAKNKIGNARIIFRTDGLKKSIIVKVRRYE